MTMRIAALHRYPVKSLGGTALAQAEVEPRGLAGDRRWMMVTPEGRFLTRRELPVMAHVQADCAPGGIVLAHRDGAQIAVAEPAPGAARSVRVWGDSVTAQDAGDAAAQWLSDVFARPVRLVFMSDTDLRPVDAGHDGDLVSFADAYPLLVTTIESLDALNARLAARITMERFRPNLVIAGAPAAYAEAGWQALRIGDVTLRVAKACTRCVITTQDPDSGEVTEPGEPLRSLRAMGWTSARGEPVFGQNAIPEGPGVIAVGDAVEVVLPSR